MPQIYIFFL